MFTFPIAHFGGALDFTIDQAIRFNDDDSAFLKDAAYSSSPTSSTDCTLSFWVKRCNLSTTQCLFFGGDGAGSTWEIIRFESDDQFRVAQASSAYDIITTQVFRDVGAWSNFVIAFNGDDSTAADRIKIYHNGSRITDFSLQTNPSSSYVTNFNSGGGSEERLIGFQGPSSGGSNAADCYLAEINFIDGQALDPTSFGETNSDTGQWVPINTSGLTFGTNGYRITGADSSDLGADQAGSNNFTSSGLSSADSVTDSPTANQSTLNPLWAGAGLSDGNLVATASGNSYQWAVSTFAVDDGGKHVCEFQKSSGTFGYVGLYQLGNHTATTGNNYGYFYNLGTGEIVKNGSLVTDLGTGAANSLMRLEYDSATDTLEFFDDGSSIHSATTGLSGHNSLHFGCAPYASGTIITATFSPLSGTPTSGFNELTASNLSTTIDDPGDYFNTVLYTGNGSTGQSITGVGFQPDFTWTKIRSPNSYSHQLFDAVRGAGKNIQSNASNAEGDLTSEFISFDSDGFTIDDVAQNVNESGSSYVAWNWEANGAGSSNTDGDITSTVSASPTSGVSVLTYSGNGSDNQEIGHGLGIAPKMIWTKRRDSSGNWTSYHDAVGINQVFYLNSTALPASNTEQYRATPTSSVYTVGVGGDINNSSGTYVAMVFAEVNGFSRISSYVGNGGTENFVHTGMKPAWLLIKRISGSTQEWQIYDNQRDPFNVGNHKLESNSSSAESILTTDNNVDFVSNGFVLRKGNGGMNASGSEYLFMCFAESPFKTATAR